MKKIVYILSFLSFTLMLTSCFSGNVEDPEESLDELIKSSTEYDIIEIEGLYSMKIPKFMTVSTQFQNDVSLQYSHPFKEKYITVLDERKDKLNALMREYGFYNNAKSGLENYRDMRMNHFQQSGISIINQTDLKSEVINDCKAFSTIIDAAVPEVAENITYYFTYLEGKEHYYVITAWTLISRKDGYANEVREMTRSFKEL